MQTDQIIKALHTDEKTQPIFRGVYARDEFINQVNYNDDNDDDDDTHLYVCNLDKSNQPGSHWVVIERTPNQDINYFDSYGLPPIFADLYSKLVQMSRNGLQWNDATLQEYNTNVCGQYCVLYCLLRARDYEFEHILDTIHHDDNISCHERDHAVSLFVNYYFHPVLPELLGEDIHNVINFF
jgi:hypothetical protein